MQRRRKNGLDLALGILCLAGGLFFVGQAVSVTTLWYRYSIGSFQMPTGIIFIPLLVGIGMLFYNPKLLAAKIVTAVGILLILLTVLLSVRITLVRVSLLEFVMMFALIVAGGAFLLRYCFKKA